MSVCLVDMRGEVVGGKGGRDIQHEGKGGLRGAGGGIDSFEKKIAGAAGSKFEYGIGGFILLILSQKIK